VMEMSVTGEGYGRRVDEGDNDLFLLDETTRRCCLCLRGWRLAWMAGGGRWSG
jgi:hypothetical protein